MQSITVLPGRRVIQCTDIYYIIQCLKFAYFATASLITHIKIFLNNETSSAYLTSLRNHIDVY